MRQCLNSQKSSKRDYNQGTYTDSERLSSLSTRHASRCEAARNRPRCMGTECGGGQEGVRDAGKAPTYVDCSASTQSTNR